jgi:glutamate carboxypeptidase
VVTSDLVQHFRGELDAMLAELQELVETESPSQDAVALSRCAVLLSDLGRHLLGSSPEEVVVDGRVHLRWSFGTPRVALLCHFDTVWPVGTIERMPFRIDDGRAYGPGVLDMKSSIVQAFHALSQLPDPDGIELLVTSDEEIGSPTSRPMIEALAKRVDAVLVIEPSQAGALKIGRKGVGMYRLRVIGRAAHAGFPHEGVNASLELAHQVLAIAALGREDVGTTVTPTSAVSGTTNNVVPAEATMAIDVRVPDAAEQARVDAALRALTPVLAGSRLELEGGANRPPLEPSSTAALFAVAQKVARAVGLGELSSAIVGGASDGNFAAAVGARTLDGLGCVGDGAHADHEHIQVSTLPERTALLAALVEELLQRP